MARRKVIKSSPIVQYKCANCGTMSPHNNKCFFCGCTQKERLVGLSEAKPRLRVNKGSGINVTVR